MTRVSSNIGGSDRGSMGVGKTRMGIGLARSPVTEHLLSRSAEDATSIKEGVTCHFPVTTVTSPRSELEAEDGLNEEP